MYYQYKIVHICLVYKVNLILQVQCKQRIFLKKYINSSNLLFFFRNYLLKKIKNHLKKKNQNGNWILSSGFFV